MRCGVCHVAEPPDAHLYGNVGRERCGVRHTWASSDAHRFVDGEHERAARAQPFVLAERRQAVVAAEEVE